MPQNERLLHLHNTNEFTLMTAKADDENIQVLFTCSPIGWGSMPGLWFLKVTDEIGSGDIAPLGEPVPLIR